MRNVIIFGVGRYFQNRRQIILESNTEIVAFLDNNPKLQGVCKDGIPIVSPDKFNQYTYDKIVLMSVEAHEMRKQLMGLGADESDIWDWEQYFSAVSRGNFKFYCGNNKAFGRGRKILIISTYLNYNGGTIAAIYAAKALQSLGYHTVICSYDGNQKFITETVQSGIDIMLCRALPYLYEEEFRFVQQFDAVVVNVFQMIACACEISKIKPVMWWIHEPGMMYEKIYEDIMSRFGQYTNSESMKNINIFAVSSIAQINFNYYFPNEIKNILEYGIPDENEEDIFQKENKNKTIFAIIGAVSQRKAQEIFVRAIGLLDDNDKVNAEFWIIGSIGEDECGRKIKELASNESSIKIMGLLTRKELRGIYTEIDVVVCPSLEDPLPIVMTECMMYGKTCIVSDATGTIDYIEDGKNGFICKKGDITDLSQKMGWIINNKEKMQEIGLNARRTYEEYFTLEKFGERLETALLSTIEKYEG